MKHIVKLVLLAIIVICGSGCTTGYWMNRGRDVADVFTVAVGFGGGAQARIGPFSQGLGAHFNVVGLQDGVIFPNDRTKLEDGGMDGAFVLYAFSVGNAHPQAKKRGKRYETFHLFGIALPVSIACNDPIYPASSFTQIEGYIGLGGTIKAGFNPGELLDFILGFFGVDIYNDDIEE